MKTIITILKYLDIFGTKYTFYSNKRPKLYTVTGGVLSIFSILFCILIPFIFVLNDLKRTSPITTVSTISSEGFRKIKFGQEKIWIPWRIVDNNDNIYVNHSGLLFPIIYYIYGTKNKETKKMNTKAKKLNYKLCNETSMAIKSEIYRITIPLNELYCIDMDDLDMGGSWISEFINYVQFDLYFCQGGINYNETDPKCTSYNDILNHIGQNNSIKFSFYYPEVEFQPTNKKNPILVIYRQHFFHIRKYTYKIERIFLQENILTDDSGWMVKNEKNSSYWGLNLVYGDNYFIGEGNDLLNEGSTSRAYSFNIYLEPGIIHYNRYYKKLHSILSDALPISLFIFFIFKNISKIIKFTEGNKKMIELLFENLEEKPTQFEENLNKIKIKKNINNNIGRLSFTKPFERDEMFLKSKNKLKISVDYSINNKNFEHSFDVKKRNTNLSLTNTNHRKSPLKFSSKKKNNNFIDMSNQNLVFSEYVRKKEYNSPEKRTNKNKILRNFVSEKSVVGSSPKRRISNYSKGKLFPYKYYLFSVFIKNLNISKGNFLFSNRFLKVYTFLCQLFDVTTYIASQREFNVLKNCLSEQNIKIVEGGNKINVNSKNFLKDISNCIGEHKFNILAENSKK